MKFGGRKVGTPNKVTADIKALAQVHGPEAIKELARLASKAESEPARVAAIKELLERGYGKVSQAIGAAEDLPPLLTAVEWRVVDSKR